MHFVFVERFLFVRVIRDECALRIVMRYAMRNLRLMCFVVTAVAVVATLSVSVMVAVFLSMGLAVAVTGTMTNKVFVSRALSMADMVAMVVTMSMMMVSLPDLTAMAVNIMCLTDGLVRNLNRVRLRYLLVTIQLSLNGRCCVSWRLLCVSCLLMLLNMRITSRFHWVVILLRIRFIHDWSSTHSELLWYTMTIIMSL